MQKHTVHGQENDSLPKQNGNMQPEADKKMPFYGNVWEYTQDWYNVNYYKELESEGLIRNPKGAKKHLILVILTRRKW
ncbi:hypothetical protein [Christiangramia salexigens]|uniref:Sulfatase-modifying factor enzyme domain-containing protein n=1 Tax=Christiangramia salexigens TaxID=1913577 RepID=A0A1L3J1N5_9FLAO|nr:hypothetical protein [Christiangramia salexigens]APG59035.1 hypothetical protein LPB144_00830 [Christiangramia salexigens]